MPVIQRDFCRTAAATVSGKNSRTEMTLASRSLRRGTRSGEGARPM